MRRERPVDWLAMLLGKREDHKQVVTENDRDIPESTCSESRSAFRSRCARMEFPVTETMALSLLQDTGKLLGFTPRWLQHL